MKKLYEAQVTNVGGRTGKSFAIDQSFSVDIAPAKELSGIETKATNPEQLFAAGYSACFNSALQSVLRRDRIKYESSEVTAFVALLLDPSDKGYMLGVRIVASVKGINLEMAEKYVKQAHGVCPYSKAIRGNIIVDLEVK
ncbi:MAG: organic hydroperoxide resistance protein [Candidatus Izemoplasmatales bacterium]|nr:organic hydroperoxide resistance protein [Candidatus Izemoplasmatales bacterium]MDD4595828.1 organic hydroperoxide resistance protein [Candidatus Izemoplasmatales bacterium]